MRIFLQNPWTVSIASNLVVLGLTAATSGGFRVGSVPLYVPIAAIMASFGATALLHSGRRVRFYYSREAAYQAALRAIEAAQPTRNENVIWIESFTGMTDPHKRQERRGIPVIREYEAAIVEFGRLAGPEAF